MTRRCPLALIKRPWVQQALSLYAMHKRGITPNGRGLRQETAFYRDVMLALDGLSAEAESWYSKQLESKRKRSK